MRTVWKFPLERSADVQRLRMPVGADILRVGTDARETPCLWTEVDDAEQYVDTLAVLVPTGGKVPGDGFEYVGSIEFEARVWEDRDTGELRVAPWLIFHVYWRGDWS